MATNRLSKRELNTIMGPSRIRKELEALEYIITNAKGVDAEERANKLYRDTLDSMRYASSKIAETIGSISAIGTSIMLTEDERPELERELQQWRNLNNELIVEHTRVGNMVQDIREAKWFKTSGEAK